jgi:hypothetical protein
MKMYKKRKSRGLHISQNALLANQLYSEREITIEIQLLIPPCGIP